MIKKPAYKKLEQKIKKLEKEALLYKQTEELLHRKQEELKTRNQIINAILNTFKLEERLELILDEILKFLQVESGAIHLVQGEQLVLRNWRGLSSRFRAHILSFPISNPPPYLQKLCVIHTLLDDQGNIPPFAKEEGIQAWTSIPLFAPASGEGSEKKWIGSILVASKRYDALKTAEVEALQRMSDQLALAIEHALAFRQAQERLIRLETLHRIDRAIIKHLNLKDVLHVAMDGVPKELGADAVAISLIDEKNQRGLKVFTMRLPNGTVIEEKAFTLAESLLHWFLDRQEIVIIYDLTQDPRLQMHRQYINDKKLISYLGVPLIVSQRTIGILHILSKQPKVFAEEDIEFFRTMAGQVAIAIENARLFEETYQKTIQLEEKVGEVNKAKKSLEESERQFRDLVENSPFGILIIKNNLIVYQNPVQKRIFKPLSPPSDFKGLLKTIHPDDLLKFSQFCEEISEEAEIQDLDLRLFLLDRDRKKEQTKWVHCRGSPIEYRGEKALLINMINISRMKELERISILQEKMASLGHIAAGIAHEIRNPLSGINIFLDTIKENLYDPEAAKDIEDMIDEAKAVAGKIEAVIKRVLNFSRPGKPQMKLIDINKPIEEAIKLATVNLRKYGITLEAHLKKGLSKVYADIQLIEQIILNLLSNAAEAMKEVSGTKKILISASESKEHIIIKVGDSGPGIPLNMRETIFEPFYTTKKTGSGIGLSICQRIISDHNGTISVSSSHLGGAEFTLQFPTKSRSK